RFVVGFKAMSRVEEDELLAEAQALMDRSECRMVVANVIEDVKRGRTKVILVGPGGAKEQLEGTKAEVADRIMDAVVRMIR
ncbi:MAG: phosphopantothenoylcysteine synthase, partial [Thermoplasmata archaeon]